MLYDIYEVRQLKSNGDIVAIERIYQPTEPMYDSNALIKVIKNRVSTQTSLDIDEIKVVNIGQVENIGGEPPRV